MARMGSRTTGSPRVLYLVTSSVSCRFLRGQLRELTSAGYEVHIASASGKSLSALADQEGAIAHEIGFRREPRVLDDVVAFTQTVRLIRRLRPSIVNASTPKASLLGIVAAWLCLTPVRIYVVRGFRFETYSGLRRRILRSMERMTIRLAHECIFNSQSLLELARRERLIGADKGVVLGQGSGNGIDLSRFDALDSQVAVRRRYGLPEDAEVLGFIGRLTRDKGVFDVVYAFEKLAFSRPRARLLLVGDYEEGNPVPAETRARIAANELIVSIPTVPDIAAVLPALDLLIFPSYREGLPNVPLEAQAVGIPVVGYAATGTVDAVQTGSTGILVPVGEADELGFAIAALLDDDGLRRAYGARGRQWVADAFRSEVIWLELIRLYRSSLAAQKGSR